jgi:hypothetical protein
VPPDSGDGEKGAISTRNRRSSGFQKLPDTTAATDSRRVAGSRPAPGGSASRVSMLRDASWSTAITGFSVGRSSRTHSGWFTSTATSDTIASLRSSSRPTPG